MIRKIISTAIVLVIGLLIYNYFFGTAEEKKQAKEIFGKGAEVVDAGAGLLKAEYQKFREGKYDKALNKIGDVLTALKKKGGELVDEIEEWEEKKGAWEEKKEELEKQIESGSQNMDEDQAKKALDELTEEGKALEEEGNRLKEKAEQ